MSEAAIPLSVRRGEKVLAKSAGKGSKDIYHTRACHVVRSCDGLIERTPRYVEDRDYEECQFCEDPETVVRNSMKSSQSDDLEPLVDSREVALEATLGEKLNLTMLDRDGYACEWAVIDTEEPTTWEAPTGDSWQTRRIRISQKMNGSDHYSECELVVAADEIRLEDPPVKSRSAQPYAPSWRIESVGAVGRVSPSTYAQLQGRQEQENARPEGDDTWRRYQRGETA
ncbi:helix-hairpin-helix domain-containing protein [Halorubrum saccharovorum]|uniref:helix-hairpin-helix domain-containing protein n=1 Tax=Halorubrum saccharovorum TaxID=2248 RepID=UPI00128DB985|nr:helix-hairpin-helix domain-containing protein [Halorubrum saccharovorum]